jgi:hypothetical protein
MRVFRGCQTKDGVVEWVKREWTLSADRPATPARVKRRKRS